VSLAGVSTAAPLFYRDYLPNELAKQYLPPSVSAAHSNAVSFHCLLSALSVSEAYT
jgi:hypothetical protein